MANAQDIIVTLAHPHGDVDTTLTQWMEIGPGPRPFVRPVAAREATTGASLPLTVVPLRYRNTALSRALIKMRVLKDPWRR